MGNASFEKGIKSSVLQEFENLLQNKQRNYLTVSEIVKFQHPEHYPFTFDHLGNLFVLNASRSGVFTVEELYKFAEFCEKNLRNIKTYEFQSQLQAATTQVLLQHLQTENGENEIVDWCESMLVRNEKNETTFERTGSTRFIRIQTVNILYEIFKVKLMNGMEIQSFFYLLQQCGEEAGLMAPDMKELDEYAPAEMGKEFARQYLRGFAKLMKEVGFNDGLSSTTAVESNQGQQQFQVPAYNRQSSSWQQQQQQQSLMNQEQQQEQYQRKSNILTLQQQSNNTNNNILQNYQFGGEKQILPSSLSAQTGGGQQLFQRQKVERLSHNSMDIENEEDDDEDDDDNDEYDYEDDEQLQQQQQQQQQPFYHQSGQMLEQSQEQQQQTQAYQLHQNIINPQKGSNNRNNSNNDVDNTMNRSSMNNSKNIQNNEEKVVTIPALNMGSMMLKGGKKSQ